MENEAIAGGCGLRQTRCHSALCFHLGDSENGSLGSLNALAMCPCHSSVSLSISVHFCRDFSSSCGYCGGNSCSAGTDCVLDAGVAGALARPSHCASQTCLGRLWDKWQSQNGSQACQSVISVRISVCVEAFCQFDLLECCRCVAPSNYL